MATNKKLLDPFMAHLGFHAEIIAPGQARVWATLQSEHLNSFGSAHGGYLYTLADAAFALAANAHGPLAVALSTHMEYMKTVKVGEVVEARAREVNLGGRTGLYHVDVCSGETLLAQFTGTAYRKRDQKSWLADLKS
jgi:acyl-CoA thioesterase